MAQQKQIIQQRQARIAVLSPSLMSFLTKPSKPSKPGSREHEAGNVALVECVPLSLGTAVAWVDDAMARTGLIPLGHVEVEDRDDRAVLPAAYARVQLLPDTMYLGMSHPAISATPDIAAQTIECIMEGLDQICGLHSQFLECTLRTRASSNRT